MQSYVLGIWSAWVRKAVALLVVLLALSASALAGECGDSFGDKSPASINTVKYVLDDAIPYIEAEYKNRYPNGEEIDMVTRAQLCVLGHQSYVDSWKSKLPDSGAGDWARNSIKRTPYLAAILHLIKAVFPYTKEGELDAYMKEAVSFTEDWIMSLPIDPPEKSKD